MISRVVRLVIAIAALFAAVAGSISDSEAGKKSNAPMRYYGGPKYPMWRG